MGLRVSQVSLWLQQPVLRVDTGCLPRAPKLKRARNPSLQGASAQCEQTQPDGQGDNERRYLGHRSEPSRRQSERDSQTDRNGTEHEPKRDVQCELAHLPSCSLRWNPHRMPILVVGSQIQQRRMLPK